MNARPETTTTTNIFDPDAAVPDDLPPLDVCACGKVPPAHADGCPLLSGAYHRRRTGLWRLPIEVTKTEPVEVETATDGYGLEDDGPHLWIGGSICLSGPDAVRALAGVLLAAARTMDEQEDGPVVTPGWFAARVTEAASTPLRHRTGADGTTSLTLGNGWSVQISQDGDGIGWEAFTSTGVLAVAGGWKPGDTRPAGKVAADVADLIDTFLSARA